MKESAKNKKFCVYMHITPSNKRYVGITCKSPNRRWESGSGYKNNRHFYNAIMKYGWDKIQHIIIAENLPVDEAEKMEIALIEKYQTNNPLYGYNHTAGGETNQSFTKETRKKMSKSAKSRASTNQGKENLKKATEKSKQNKHGTKVVCDGKIFDSVTECSKYLNLSRRILSQILIGRLSFTEELKNRGLGYYGVASHYEEAKRTHNRPVICDGVEYKTCAECNRAYGLRNGAIKEYLSGMTKIPEKFKALGLKYIDYKRYYYIVDE